jgi:hypothetical protein
MDNRANRLYSYSPSSGEGIPVRADNLCSVLVFKQKAPDVDKPGEFCGNLQARDKLMSSAGRMDPCPEISNASAVCDEEASKYIFFIQPLPSVEVHSQVVEIWQWEDQAEMLKSIFSTQNDPSLCAFINSRARGDGTVVREQREVSLNARRSHDRDPGPGLLAFSRSPVSGPLFYKRNFNPQNGGYA